MSIQFESNKSTKEKKSLFNAMAREPVDYVFQLAIHHESLSLFRLSDYHYESDSLSDSDSDSDFDYDYDYDYGFSSSGSLCVALCRVLMSLPDIEPH